MPFADMVVLIPGILGSVLRKGTSEIWSLGAGPLFRALKSFGRNLNALTLDHDSMDDAVDDVVATRLLPDATILPGLWRVDGYTRIADMLRARLGLVDQENYFEFPYDWRRDNRVAARQLSERVPAWLDLHRRRTNNPEAKVWFLGHSMGGLVARYYLEKLGGRTLARGLVTFGTPYRGSMNALDVLVNGLTKGFGPITVVDLTAMARSLTSLHQLLPTYTSVDDAGTLKHLVDLPSVPQVDPAKLKDARAFYAEMDEAAARVKGTEPSYRLFPFVGFKQPTSLSARLSEAGATMLPMLGNADFQGDGTVPRLSATPDEWANAGLERYATERHASLQNAPDVLQQLEGILTDANVGSFRAWVAGSAEPNRYRWGITAAERIGLSLQLDDVVAVGDRLAVLCQPVRSDPPTAAGPDVPFDAVDLTAYIVNLETKHTAAVPLRRMPDGWHYGETRAATAGAYRVTVTGGAGVTPVSDVFAVFERPGAPLSVPVPEGLVRWSNVHLVADASASIATMRGEVQRLPTHAGIVLRVDNRSYAVRAGELRASFRNRDAGLSLMVALDLHEDQQSEVVERVPAQEADASPLLAALPPPATPWRGRFILAEQGQPFAIGEATHAVPDGDPTLGGELRAEPQQRVGLGAPAEGVVEHEIVKRMPALAVRGRLAPTELVAVDVDLALAKAVDVPGLLAFKVATDWSEIPVLVRLLPPVDLIVRAGDDVRSILVRKDAPSVPCSFAATVAPTAKPGSSIAISVSFSVAGAFVGAAQAVFPVQAPDAAGSPATLDEPPSEVRPTASRGTAELSTLAAKAPVLTVQIVRTDPALPGDLYWLMSVATSVEGLPPRLSGRSTLRTAPAEYARSLANGAAPRRTGHLAFFKGVGSELWNAAPGCFRETYTVLRAKLGTDFDIQFISDDPYIPWELIWPDTIADAQALCVDHPVARWIMDYQTSMASELPRGQVVTIAPDYTRSITVPPLPSAQLEAQLLCTRHRAAPINPVRADVLALFATKPLSPVGFLHFAGHGAFLGGASGSQIYLEDEPLASVELRAGNNVLAQDARTLVFFNACETAAGGDSLAWPIARCKCGASAGGTAVEQHRTAHRESVSR